jgi:putative sterol carrier protein
MGGVPLAYRIFEDDWVQAFQDRVNESEEYRRSASTWHWPLVLRMQPDASLGFPDGYGVWLDLHRGECRAARVAKAEDMRSAPYVISADAYTWKQVLQKELEPISGLLRGKLKLEKGNMLTLASYVQAARYLVEAAREIDTVFPEGV